MQGLRNFGQEKRVYEEVEKRKTKKRMKKKVKLRSRKTQTSKMRKYSLSCLFVVLGKIIFVSVFFLSFFVFLIYFSGLDCNLIKSFYSRCFPKCKEEISEKLCKKLFKLLTKKECEETCNEKFNFDDYVDKIEDVFDLELKMEKIRWRIKELKPDVVDETMGGEEKFRIILLTKNIDIFDKDDFVKRIKKDGNFDVDWGTETFYEGMEIKETDFIVFFVSALGRVENSDTFKLKKMNEVMDEYNIKRHIGKWFVVETVMKKSDIKLQDTFSLYIDAYGSFDNSSPERFEDLYNEIKKLR